MPRGQARSGVSHLGIPNRPDMQFNTSSISNAPKSRQPLDQAHSNHGRFSQGSLSHLRSACRMARGWRCLPNGIGLHPACYTINTQSSASLDLKVPSLPTKSGSHKSEKHVNKLAFPSFWPASWRVKRARLTAFLNLTEETKIMISLYVVWQTPILGRLLLKVI